METSMNAIDTWKALLTEIENAERARPLMHAESRKVRDGAIIAYCRAVDAVHKHLIALRDMGTLEDFETFLEVTFGGVPG